MDINTAQAPALSEFRRPVEAPHTSPVAIDRPGALQGAGSFTASLASASDENARAVNNLARDVDRSLAF